MSSRRTISNTFTVTTMDDPVSVQAQYAPNANPTSGQIHTVWQEGDLYMRTRESDESAWSSWHRIVGESGDETEFSFGISQYKTTANASTAPSDISSWSDAPLAVTTAKPYLWAKVQQKSWNASTQAYVVDSTRYIRLTGEDGYTVEAQYAPNNNPTSSQIHTTWQDGDLYMRTKQSNETTWSSWHRIVGESGDETDYTFNISQLLTSSSATTAPANCYYNTWQDAPVAPTSTYPYLWMKIVKKTWNESTQSYDSGTARYARITGEPGTSPIFADLDNEMDSVACNSSGYTNLGEQYVSTNFYYYKGSAKQTQSFDSITCKIDGYDLGTSYTSNADPSRYFKISSRNLNYGSLTIAVKNGTYIDGNVEVKCTVVMTIDGASVSRTLTLTINGVRAGQNGSNGTDGQDGRDGHDGQDGADGQNAILFNLLPSRDAISFARTSSGGLTPSEREVSLVIKKTDGGTSSIISISNSGLSIRYSFSSMPSTSSSGTNWGNSDSTSGTSWYNGTLYVANSVTFTNLYIAAFNSSGVLVDSETIPVVKDGNNGDDAPAAFASPAQISIPCYSNGNVKASSTTSVTFTLKVGTNSGTVTGVSSGTKPTGVTVTGVADNAVTITVGTSATAIGLAPGVTFTVTGTYGGKTYSANVTVALIGSTQGEEGQSTNGEDAQYIYLKGTGNNNPQSAVCKINNGTTITTRTISSRGLTLILINRLTLEVYSQTTYDVYGETKSAGETQCANLATAINNASSSYFVCLVSCDAVRWTNNLIVALQACGCKGIDDTTAYRVPFAFIGFKGLPQGYGIQMQSGQGANDAPAEVTAYVSNGALSTSKDPTAGRLGGRFYYDAGDFEYSSSLSFKVTASEAPYFFYDNDYWVFEPNVTSDMTYTTADMGYPSSNNSNWHLMMYNTQRFFMSDAIFGKYAHFGSAIINGDWIISSNGSVLGTNYNDYSYITGKIINTETTQGDFKIKAYTLFEPSNPLNDTVLINSGTNQTISASATTKTLCQPNLIKGKVYKLTVTGRKSTSDSAVYIRIRNNTYGTYTAIYLANTSDGTYNTTFQVETSAYYYIEMYQPTLPTSSSGGGVVTSYSLVRAIFKTAYAVDLKMGISYQTKIYASGGLRSPFTYMTSDGIFTTDFNDNVAVYSGSQTSYSLPWDASQSGRKVVITNYYWNGNYSTSSGFAKITAPSGKYFYEDGITKSTLKLSREAVELLGYGDASYFYGWVVLKRIDLGTKSRYGHHMKMLASGRVTGSSSGASVSYHSFDGTTMSVTRDGTGIYTLSWSNNDWYADAGHVFVMVCGYGVIDGGSNPLYASVKSQTKTSITVQTADDDSRNDGAFNFFLMNFSDWAYL